MVAAQDKPIIIKGKDCLDTGKVLDSSGESSCQTQSTPESPRPSGEQPCVVSRGSSSTIGSVKGLEVDDERMEVGDEEVEVEEEQCEAEDDHLEAEEVMRGAKRQSRLMDRNLA